MAHCFYQCNPYDHGDQEQNECAAKCYVHAAALLRDDRSINKLAVKRIYEANSFYHQRWFKVINESVEKCSFEALQPLTVSLPKFYACVNQELEENCADFSRSIECDKTEEFFESCRNTTIDCTQWPDSLVNSAFCCKTPRIFSNHQVSTCQKNCSAKEFFLPRQLKCEENCLHNLTHSQEKIDFSIVQKMLLENSKDEPLWEKHIEEAVSKCEHKMKCESSRVWFPTSLTALNDSSFRRIQHEPIDEELVPGQLPSRAFE